MNSLDIEVARFRGLVKRDDEIVEESVSSENSSYRELVAKASPYLDYVRHDVKTDIMEERRSARASDDSTERGLDTVLDLDPDRPSDA